ncbi:hypothetical protein [Candidatus Magnetobacterium casense]|uniref:Uncharacterized protein n=1 Tax=Candidatus Magnetobacterium casense TaxID=1455061 RepID=A0ABS6S3U8_9BACT|nr:hypothetical protein [Candidatus Magnetobacterium casensis]MBV6343527.1 hypothetical protein [Candidatus Magnetobacterium casensis]
MTDYQNGHEPPTTQDPIFRDMISRERSNRIAELEAEIARLTSERDRAVEALQAVELELDDMEHKSNHRGRETRSIMLFWAERIRRAMTRDRKKEKK